MLLFFGERQDFVNNTIFDRLRGAHKVITIRISLNAIQCLARMMLDNLVKHIARMHNLTSLDINGGSLPTDPAINQGLMHMNASVRERTAQTFITSHKQDS